MFTRIVLRDFARPVKDRGHYPHSSVGPYYFQPLPNAREREGWSTYTDASESETMFRLRYEDANDHLTGRAADVLGYWTDEHGDGDTIKPIVWRLPRGRGFLAGWTMGAGMCASVDAGIFADPESAAYAAHSVAEYAAERERDARQEDEEDQDQDEDEEEPAPVMLPDHMVEDIERRARNERAGGGTVEINHGLPFVVVTLSDGSEFFFQESEASQLLDTVPDNVSPEDFILWQAQGW